MLVLFEAYSACVGNQGFDGTLGNAQQALTCGTCVALDQCHDVGVCNPESGFCTNPVKSNGTGCNDSNACTTGETCQAGVCGSGTATVCTALDQCHVAGSCNPGNGQCTNPNKADNSGCNDGNACTQTDTCQGGVCSGASPVVCPAPGQCKVIGTCNPANGTCSAATNAGDGSSCNDGDLCTQTDSCMGGTCVGANPKTCSGGDTCNSGSTCNPQTGSCGGGAPMNEGGACTDGNKCTTGDKCTSGSCVGTAVSCTSPNPCLVGSCDGATGSCTFTAVADNTACNDGKTCTSGDKCMSGVCTGNVSCPASDACHDPGVCAADNSCTNPKKADGASCDYEKWVNPGSASNRCTTPNDMCMAGVCVADTHPVVCPQLDCNTVACDTTTGNCVYTPVTPGNVCGTSGCSTAGTCSTVSGMGQCSGTPKDCSASSAACKTGVCDASNGMCSGLNVANGVSCATSDKCLAAPTCQAGSCVGEPKTCAPKGECGVAMCNPSTGDCDDSVAPVGTPCAGTDQCSPLGACDVAGNCVASTAQDGTPCSSDDCPTSGACVTGACLCITHSDPSDNPGPADQPATPDEHGCSIGATSATAPWLGFLLLVLALGLRRVAYARVPRRRPRSE
jgi:hypothetical protein